MQLSIERVVALASPIFVASAGWLSGAVAKYGIHLNKTGIVAVMTTGAVSAAAAAIKWLDGRQKSEALAADLRKAELVASPILKQIDPSLAVQVEAIFSAAAKRAATAILPSDEVEAAHPPVPPVVVAPAPVAPALAPEPPAPSA